MERTCANCGKTFTVNRHCTRYCSKACREAIYRNVKNKVKGSNQKKCAFCGEPFVPSNNAQTYCCNDCRISASAKRREKNTKICKNCGLAFRSTDKHRVYCSKDCQRQFYRKSRPTFERQCDFCGRPFKTKDNTHFCSEECRYNAQRLRQKNRKLNPYMNDPMVQESIKSLVRLELYFGGTPNVKQYMADHNITEELAARLIREATEEANAQR